MRRKTEIIPSNPRYSSTDSKFIILYLLRHADMPLAMSKIQLFALNAQYMDYYELTAYIADMIKNGYIKKAKEDNEAFYTLTDSGLEVIAAFEELIPTSIRENIYEFVANNKAAIKNELEVTAVYNKIENEYEIKCGLYDDTDVVMEIKLKFGNKEYTKKICSNWKNNPSEIYSGILRLLIGSREQIE